MATRDRTPAFNLLKSEFKNRRPSKSYNQSESDDDSNNVPLVALKGTSSGGNAQPQLKELNVLPPWMQKINDIDLNLKKISELIDKLKGYHDKNLLPDMSMEDQSDLERSIEITTTEITRLFHKTHDYIKNLGKGANLSPEDQKMKKNIQNSKSAKLQSLSLTFRQKQRIFLTALQKRSNAFSEWGIDFNDEEEGGVVDLDFSDELKQVVDHMELEITQRDQDIRKIVASINDLSQLFQDISILVVQQGTLLDRIDHNLETAYEDVKQGTVEIEETNQLHKEYRTRLCILMILVALVVAMVFLFILRIIF
ncbi:hypothetical protein DICPUDRAFT_149802 [Dictyostelium purpureum]|uniref:t-SNARE coiled-coil homology domain-containing protein n=1 Tax=Dictyostelium purpureum TaxID=5786 RepID=F0ZEQ1_DICPU|nr:uncharacterized protein DICPUDRAFT_149802 [Dictyostelium purpureum]EGC37577.1 hypothetical protein DICPUDRAFT_149802 [Dictyostelium purpureum]|eukprot:XP_003285903.1 hypothetical protein DICPUDRAFT_149802 [Dictyostelium purpureum]